MQYVTGIHALNLPCALDTPGDWHTSALKWKNIKMKDSSISVFQDFGIESNKTIPEHSGKYYVANHIRACLDLLEDGDFSNAQGMRNNYIGNQKYDKLIFLEVLKLRPNNDMWPKISKFMEQEYKLKWINYIKRVRDV